MQYRTMHAVTTAQPSEDEYKLRWVPDLQGISIFQNHIGISADWSCFDVLEGG